MKYRWPLRAAKFLAIAAVILLVFGFVVMALWNTLIPDLFKGPTLTYWQALGLLVLSRLFFHGWARWGYSGSWRHRSWRRRFDERLASMTPEEREKVREEWRRKCGWYPGQESEAKPQTNV